MDESSAVGTITEWDELVFEAHSNPHYMQSSAWAAFKELGPWSVVRTDIGGGSPLPVQAFERLAVDYGRLRHLPRISGIRSEDVPGITSRIRSESGDAFAVKIEVHQPPEADLVDAFEANGWRRSRASQYRYSVHVRPGDGRERMLADMKKRARWEIRQSERSEVRCERVEVTEANTEIMLGLVEGVAKRTAAFFRARAYLLGVWNAFSEHGQGRLYFARHGENVVAGAFVVTFGPTAWFKDGGSTRDQPQLLASRMLHWVIMCDLADDGFDTYDLGNIPDPATTPPGSNGLLTFKSGFARQTVEFMPAFDLALKPSAESWRRGESDFLRRHNERTQDYFY